MITDLEKELKSIVNQFKVKEDEKIPLTFTSAQWKKRKKKNKQQKLSRRKNRK